MASNFKSSSIKALRQGWGGGGGGGGGGGEGGVGRADDSGTSAKTALIKPL